MTDLELELFQAEMNNTVIYPRWSQFIYAVAKHLQIVLQAGSGLIICYATICAVLFIMIQIPIDSSCRKSMYDSGMARQMQGTYIVADREKQALRNEIKNLQSKMFEQGEENRKLQYEVQAIAQKGNEELKIQREKASMVINEYATKFKKREADVIVLRNSLMDLKWKCMEAQEICSDVVESFHSTRESIASQADADQALKQKLRDYELKLSASQKKIKSLEDALKESNVKRNRISKLEHDLETYTSVQDNKISSMQAQIRELQLKLHAEQVKNSELKRGLEYSRSNPTYDTMDKYGSDGGVSDRHHFEYCMSLLRDANRESVFSEAKTQSQASHTSDAMNNGSDPEEKTFGTSLAGRFEGNGACANNRSDYTALNDPVDMTHSSFSKVLVTFSLILPPLPSSPSLSLPLSCSISLPL